MNGINQFITIHLLRMCPDLSKQWCVELVKLSMNLPQ